MNLYVEMSEKEYDEYRHLKETRSQDLSDRPVSELIFAAIAAINKQGGRVEDGTGVSASYRPTNIKMGKIKIGDVTYLASIEQETR